MATIRVLPADLLRVLQGYEVTVDGDVTLRLYTAEEWLPLQHAACDRYGAPANKVSLERAVELTRPLRDAS